jgi:ribose transport system substrate-binding protein
MMQKRTFARLALAVAVTSLCGLAQAADVTVAYITNGNTNEGWTLINGGAKTAGSAPGVKFIELAAEKGELSKQLASVDDMITRKVNAIAIAPVDSAGIAPAINKALAAGIVVVAVDTGISGADISGGSLSGNAIINFFACNVTSINNCCYPINIANFVIYSCSSCRRSFSICILCMR